MKVIQIEYPDKNVHKVVVSEYNHSNDTNLDYINYYDLANDRNMYICGVFSPSSPDKYRSRSTARSRSGSTFACGSAGRRDPPGP